MEIIAYNTTLDIKNLLCVEDKKVKQTIIDKQRKFEANKKKLLPYVFKYVHYLVELHNNSNINVLNGNGTYISLEDALTEVAQDCHFNENGDTWKHLKFGAFGTRGMIWLNVKPNVCATPHLDYSLVAYEGYGYAESIEDYMRQVAKKIAEVKNR